MATKKKSTSVSKKKTASKTATAPASKKSKSAPSKKTSKKAAKKTSTKSTASPASFDAPSHMDEEFAAASSPAYSPSTSPSYGAPQASEDDGKGSLLRLGALVVLGVVLVVLLSIKFLGGKSDEVADNSSGPVVEEPAGISEPETPAAPADAIDSQEAVEEAAKPVAPETKPPVASSASSCPPVPACGWTPAWPKAT